MSFDADVFVLHMLKFSKYEREFIQGKKLKIENLKEMPVVPKSS